MSVSIFSLIKEIGPLNRYNVSPDIDKTLKIIRKNYNNLKILKFKSGTSAWDWQIPKKWKIYHGFIKYNNKIIFSIEDNPLRVWSGSWSYKNKSITFDKLKKNIFFKKKYLDKIPWKYKYYFHDKNFWGFSLSFKEYKKLKKLKGPFEVDIKTEFYNDYLTMGEILIPGKSKEKIIISSDICHPGQVNDSLSGVYCALKLYEKLKNKKNFYTYLFTFQPEMIGSIAYLSKKKNLKNLKYGIFTEMMGSKGPMILQKSFKGDTLIDFVGTEVLYGKYKKKFQIKEFLDDGIVNDELILNHIDIPSIALNRGPFNNYHTSGDNFKNINKEILEDSYDTLEKIILFLENFKNKKVKSFIFRKNNKKSNLNNNNYYKKKIPGPIFLDKHNLYVDWQVDWRMNTIIDKIMIALDGRHTIDEIVKFCKCDKHIVINFINKLKRKNLIVKI